jgi:hypothetical protein
MVTVIMIPFGIAVVIAFPFCALINVSTMIIPVIVLATL